MHVRTAHELGKLIREARQRRHLTQQQLAAAVGSTQSWLSHVEHGKETAEIGLVLKVVRQLGIRLDISDPQALTPSNARSDDDGIPDADEVVSRGKTR